MGKGSGSARAAALITRASSGLGAHVGQVLAGAGYYALAADVVRQWCEKNRKYGTFLTET
ncbi:hypothetical protein [Oricola nitratireducens]|uniref:hypothetical protein n=1 Tax=Oricola nitratireducens TaxID=2775868 RepID=UPI001867AACC|nr:hypothetical protein [Oricola nitratireducens]